MKNRRDFKPVLQVLLVWGNRHFADDGRRVTIRDRQTGLEAEPILIDRISGRPLSEPAFVMSPRPAASDTIKRRYADRAEPAKAASA